MTIPDKAAYSKAEINVAEEFLADQGIILSSETLAAALLPLKHQY